MSGSPFIQDGKLIGAVTHVLIANPMEGYGIFIENMLEATQQGVQPKAAWPSAVGVAPQLNSFRNFAKALPLPYSTGGAKTFPAFHTLFALGRRNAYALWYSFAVQALPLGAMHSARLLTSHRGAICARSLVQAQTRLRLIIIKRQALGCGDARSHKRPHLRLWNLYWKYAECGREKYKLTQSSLSIKSGCILFFWII